MGHPDNITTLTFKSLGKKYGKKEPEARQWVYNYLTLQLEKPDSEKNEDIELMFTKAAKAWGQSTKEAKRLTLSMLKSEL